jgi:hypothetical protein
MFRKANINHANALKKFVNFINNIHKGLELHFVELIITRTSDMMENI